MLFSRTRQGPKLGAIFKSSRSFQCAIAGIYRTGYTYQLDSRTNNAVLGKTLIYHCTRTKVTQFYEHESINIERSGLASSLSSNFFHFMKGVSYTLHFLPFGRKQDKLHLMNKKHLNNTRNHAYYK